MNSKMISVIVPVHNGERFLAPAIQSVLDQTAPVAEIIVVDDGSTDNSAGIAKAFGPPVRYLWQANRGPAAARNQGIEQARGTLLAFLDADDLWAVDKLARQLAVLDANPACQAVLGRVENFMSPDLDINEREVLAQAAQQSGDIHIGALLIRRPAFLRIGAFDERWRQSEFVEWWSRAIHLGLVYSVVPDLVMRRRLHNTNLTRRERHRRHEYLAMLREKLAQRRAADTLPDALGGE